MSNIEFFRTIAQSIGKAGGTTYLVGGMVRNEILGVPQDSDWDFEVFNINGAQLKSILDKFGKVEEVGKSFGVFKLKGANGTASDWALPRIEQKVGHKHTDFYVESAPSLSIEKAMSRRDFTINAIYKNILTGELKDCFNGIHDANNKILRHTSLAFSEDPLRVLRAMQLAARFNLSIAPETSKLCRSLLREASFISTQRVWGEWEKWALSNNPSKGLEVLQDTYWLLLYPELLDLVGCQQGEKSHPEGDVWQHTLHVCDAMAEIVRREQIVDKNLRLLLMFASLCHDLGKPPTKTIKKGKITFHKHDIAGAHLSRLLLERIGAPIYIISRVALLTQYHMLCADSFARSSTIIKIADDLFPVTIQQLSWLAEADYSGRPPIKPDTPAKIKRIVEMAKKHNCLEGRAPYLINGNDLLKLGFSSGRQIGNILETVRKWEVRGFVTYKEQAICKVLRQFPKIKERKKPNAAQNR